MTTVRNSGTPPTAPKQLQIAATQVLPAPIPTLSIGDLLQLTVRANPKQGLGTLYFKGQLFNAALPQDLQVGDRLLARLEQAGEQLILKIVELQRKTAETPGPLPRTAPAPLTAAIDTLLAKLEATLPAQARSISLGQLANQDPLPAQVQSLRSQAAALFSAFDVDRLADSEAARSVLNAVVTGSAGSALRSVAVLLREAAGAVPLSTDERFLITLKEQVAELLQSGSSRINSRSLDSLLHAVRDELRPERKTVSAEQRALLQKAAAELAEAQIAEPKERLQSLHGLLEQVVPKTTANTTAIRELQQLATQLEQLANVYDALNQLNPLLQALGEPAMLLFPMIFQGMLAHGELLVDPDAKQQKQQQQGEQEENERGEGSDTSAYQRINLYVPLPAIGGVTVEIAHRGKEVLARIQAIDDERARFISERSGDLAGSLAALNLTLKELSASGGLDERALFDGKLLHDTTIVA